MKTLVLLSLLALLAFQAQADPLPEATKETKNEEQSEVENQDVSISFEAPEGTSLKDAATRSVKCACRRKFCWFFEQVSGICNKGPVMYVFCCR
ncbi:alpha-defensin 16-like [Microtus pennsylvanicus]|uniref:alpha-defensin 16-like n=1 Tax=Microtus pennsylvanicus TaxID=10058 RepID=UPI003F6AE413